MVLDEKSELRLTRLYMELNTADESLARNVFIYLCGAEDGKNATDYDHTGGQSATDSLNISVAEFSQRQALISLPVDTANLWQNLSVAT